MPICRHHFSVVLLIASANLAGLLLVRAIRRRGEIVVQLTLGARASTLLRRAIVEGIVLSIAGCEIGLALAPVALQVGFRRLPQTLPRFNDYTRFTWLSSGLRVK